MAQIAAAAQQFRQMNAIAFAAGQFADFPLLIRPLEVELRHVTA